MLTGVKVIGDNTELVVFWLDGSTSIQIRDIKGLEPIKAEIISVPSNLDGELFQNARLGKRNIVFQFGLNPNWVDQTMSSLRRLLYGYFPPKAIRKLRFYSDDMNSVDISGYVESIEPNMFSQDPEIQVSVICLKPNFISPVDGAVYSGI